MKLMGRNTGHIALHTTLRNRVVDCCLIPRRTSTSTAPAGYSSSCTHSLEKGHAVVVIVEGAGQRFIPRPDPQQQQQQQHDESGNPVFLDLGAWLKAELGAW